MQLLSMEWVPLFLLLWWMLLDSPDLLVAAAAAVTLGLVTLCDFYYLFYCVLAAGVVLGWCIVQRGGPSFLLSRQYALPGTLFAALAGVFTGPLIALLLITNRVDPLSGYHNAGNNSLDLLAPFIPNPGWRFNSLTSGYWSGLNRGEEWVYVGISVTVLLIYVWTNRKWARNGALTPWFAIAILFAVLSLGPVLHVWGQAVSLPIGLPYALLEILVPPLSVSGVPTRMIVMTILSAAVIYAVGLQMLCRSKSGKWIATPLLLAVLGFEYLPAQLAMSQPGLPGYVQALRKQKGIQPVIDMTLDPAMSGLGLYYQTQDDQPMAFGYIARLPSSVGLQDSVLRIHALEMRDDILFRTYGFKYLVVPAANSFPYDPIAYEDSMVKLYRLGSEDHRVYVQSILPLLQGEGPVRRPLPGATVGQTFIATRNDLAGIGISPSMTGVAVQGSLVFHLRSSVGPTGGTDLATRSVPLAGIANGYLKVFTFPPQSHSLGRHYYVYVNAVGTSPGTTVAPWASPTDSYPDGHLMIDHHPTPGTLVMQLFYRKR